MSTKELKTKYFIFIFFLYVLNSLGIFGFLRSFLTFFVQFLYNILFILFRVSSKNINLLRFARLMFSFLCIFF